MKPIYAVLILLLGFLQYQLWWAEGGVLELNELKSTLAREKSNLAMMQDHNQQLLKNIHSLKNNNAEIEARARYEHNMIKNDETFYQIVEDN